ncbi:uncharacterized protein LOC143296899 isoform X2 [Babylonia areolata]|uniref:uncharacterized protein LOC143296899 isoform X2 n=1 Tax=Babylonia areolata TaxID=304850 RepID=UPI003FD1743C
MTTPWSPSSQIQCQANEDCGDTRRVCCSITPALGKRQLGHDFYPFVHYCLPYKTEDNPWCDLRMQYSPLSPNYKGLCPCGPGLKCMPTEELDPRYYPRDRYGKCSPA